VLEASAAPSVGGPAEVDVAEVEEEDLGLDDLAWSRTFA
jgi:hypothetical protein